MDTKIFFLFFILLGFMEKGCASTGGDTTDQIPYSPRTHIVQLSSLLPKITCIQSNPGLTQGASLKLVDKHGPCSILKEEKENVPTSKQVIQRDYNRVRSIQQKIHVYSGKYHLEEPISLIMNRDIDIGVARYIINLGLGMPKQDLSFIPDTTIGLTWMRCKKQYPFKHERETFDPSISISFKEFTVNCTSCLYSNSITGIIPSNFKRATLHSNAIACPYETLFLKYLKTETITLTSHDIIQNSLFNCSSGAQRKLGTAVGLLALGQYGLSFVNQTMEKYQQIFSYCLPSTSSYRGYLRFGNNYNKSTQFTPLMIRSSDLYGLDMTGISVGGYRLRIAEKVFSNFHTVIELGTEITRLPPMAYEKLRNQFEKMMKIYVKCSKFYLFDTCYDLRGYESIIVPKIIFYFRGGVEVDIDPSGIFYMVNMSRVCLAFARTGSKNAMVIFGNMQQKRLEIVYDVGKGRIGFTSRGCN